MSTFSLTMVKSAAETFHGPVVFSMMKNEDYFLPHFFAHYRALGVVGFLIYDDHSKPPALDFLHAQPDCAVITSDRKFSDLLWDEQKGQSRPLKKIIREYVPEILLADNWVLTVDADEFIVLPDGFGDLDSIIVHLERIGQDYLTAPMVDFYGESLSLRNYARHLSPFTNNVYFDIGPYYVWNGRIEPEWRSGGIRLRLLRKLWRTHPGVVAGIYGDHPIGPAKTWKVPLVRQGRGIIRIPDHEINMPPREDITAALAHFKFYPDLDKKIEAALADGQYYNASMEYRFIKAAIDYLGEESLVADVTRRFTGPRSLEEAGLIIGGR